MMRKVLTGQSELTDSESDVSSGEGVGVEFDKYNVQDGIPAISGLSKDIVKAGKIFTQCFEFRSAYNVLYKARLIKFTVLIVHESNSQGCSDEARLGNLYPAIALQGKQGKN